MKRTVTLCPGWRNKFEIDIGSSCRERWDAAHVAQSQRKYKDWCYVIHLRQAYKYLKYRRTRMIDLGSETSCIMCQLCERSSFIHPWLSTWEKQSVFHPITWLAFPWVFESGLGLSTGPKHSPLRKKIPMELRSSGKIWTWWITYAHLSSYASLFVKHTTIRADLFTGMSSGPKLAFDSTLGAASVGFFASAILFGVLTTQVFTYFRRYPSDKPGYKALVSYINLRIPQTNKIRPKGCWHLVGTGRSIIPCFFTKF